MQHLAEAEGLTAQNLLAGARRELREETKHGIETHVTTLGEVEVLTVVDLTAVATQRKVHAREDVLRQVDGLGRLGNTALLHHVELVHDVRVTVVHPGTKNGIGALENCTKCHLGRGRKVSNRTDVAGDVLRKPDDALTKTIATLVGSELAQGTRKHHHLLEVGTLVSIDALRVMPAHERNGVILIVALAVAQDGVPGKLDREMRLLAPTGLGF
mmetsp:Transcript_71018/g.230572  ORF Transcript_71018/g.230572 Transcript_71018/m.230572 type:complete len:214 (-) Transcript_71018:3580-4221(-)